MKKRILAVLGLVLLLVPLLVLSVSAMEVEDSQDRIFDYLYSWTLDGPNMAHEATFAMLERLGNLDEQDHYTIVSDWSNILISKYDLELGNSIEGMQIVFDQSHWRGFSGTSTYSVLLGNAWWTNTVNTNDGYRSFFGYGEISIDKSTYSSGDLTTITFSGQRRANAFCNDIKEIKYQFKPLSRMGSELDSTYKETWYLNSIQVVYADPNTWEASTTTNFTDGMGGFCFVFDNTIVPSVTDYLFCASILPSSVENDTPYLNFDKNVVDLFFTQMDAEPGYDEGFEDGYNEGQDDGYTLGFSEGRIEGAEIGMHQGYTTGYTEGYEEGASLGYDDGHADGYAEGRDQGYIEGAQYSTDFGDMVIAILESPMTLIDGMLNFDLFGINMASFVKVILTLAVTAVIVFFVLKVTRG